MMGDRRKAVSKAAGIAQYNSLRYSPAFICFLFNLEHLAYVAFGRFFF
jgi:hypothetical protein